MTSILYPLVCSAFNNILSNLGYVMLGLLFLLIVLQRDVIHSRALDRNDLNALVRDQTEMMLLYISGGIMYL